MIPSAAHSRNEDTALPHTGAANPHAPFEWKEARRVPEGAGGFFSKKGPSWALGAWIKTRGLGGGSLTLAGLRAGEFH